jgi:ATP-binding cassette subfamily B protein
MMRQAPLLLVLDEPTSALDAQAEHALFARFADREANPHRAGGGITVLVSHRFSTVRGADLILVVDGGRIVERGTHDELMANRGTYAELFAMQAGVYR